MKFSICICAYKSMFIEKCINSVLNQNYHEFELIILNDFSPNPIKEIVYSFKDTRIHYYENKQNVGAERLVENWNKCLNMAVGEYVMMLGDDDYLEPNYLIEFSYLINKYPDLDVFHCRSKIVDERGDAYSLTEVRPEYESVYDSIYQRMAGYRWQFISDFVYRRDSLVDRGGFFHLPYAWASDDITSFIASKGKGIAHTNKALLNYRNTAYTISSSGNTEIKMKALIDSKKWFNEFLLTEPQGNTDEMIIYNLIKNSINKWIQKKKVNLLKKQFESISFKDAAKWFFKRHIYDISFLDFVYAFTFSFIKTD